MTQTDLGRPRPEFVHNGIAFGCDYNPEQWSPEVWAEDVRLMREAGVDLVAINIFGWSNVQPSPDRYNFDDLDAVITLLHDNGIRVNLGTGTSSAPPWLSTQHPEILPMVSDGTTRYPGGRQAWCPSSPVFRDYALRLVEKVAERYGNHPAVALWHVSNELGCHNGRCYCPTTAAAFRSWLEKKYGSIDSLNRAWGTSFWSQRYSTWSEIDTPKLTLSSGNPGQALDFQRFSSDELLSYYRSERDVIRRHSSVPVTTNFMVAAHIDNLDYWSWAPEMDVIANDHYLDHRLPDPAAELNFAADLTRGLANGEPWLLMEQATGAVNWQPHNIAKVPGEMVRNVMTHVARGADAVCSFQWRASLQGSEKFHSALVPHAGTDSAHWRSVVELGALLDRLDEVQGSRVVADVAVIFSWESTWASDGANMPSQSVKSLDQAHAAYNAARDAGLSVQMVSPDSDLSGYGLILVPGLYLVTDAQAARLADAVAAGAHAVVTYFSGIVDHDDRVRPGGYPGAFTELLGVRSEEFFPLMPGDQMQLEWVGTASTGIANSPATLWSENLHPTTAEVMATYVDGQLPGVPAVTLNSFGNGHAWYVATELGADTLRDLITRIASEAGVKRPSDALRFGSDGVEISRRVSAEHSYLFVINHSKEDVTVASIGYELVTETSVDNTLRVPAGAVRVVREDSRA